MRIAGFHVNHRHLLRDAALIIGGSFVFALGFDCFQAPNGLAAGGVSGLALVLRQVVLDLGGPDIPVGFQTIVMNALLMILVVRSGGLRYAARTVAGFMASSVFIDALKPLVPAIGGGDLLLCALWGGVVTGIGLGIVFRSGGNTGGTDIIAQVASKRTGLGVGALDMAIGLAIVAASAVVFSVEQALYAAVSMYLCGIVIDMVVDGPRTSRAAWIISSRREEVTHAVLHELDRGCTEVSAKGMWTGESRPMLFVILGRSEVGALKGLVADIDPNAIVVITDVHEVFGEGFRRIDEPR